MIIKPQEGFQEEFLSSEADIVIGGGCAGCFVGNTLVQTAEGYRMIKDIQKGEYVLSFNTCTKQLEYKKVLETFEYSNKRERIVFVFDSYELECTPNHEILYNNSWISAYELSKLYAEGNFKDSVNYGGAITIDLNKLVRIDYKLSDDDVYDLCVEDNHNYTVTEDNIIVHNSGKSFALILELARLTKVKNATGVIFRRTRPELIAGGGLWDTACQIYAPNADVNITKLELTFPSKAKIKFSHLQRDNDVYSHQGSQYAFIGFDEVQHFTWKQFRYLFSRNRTMTNIKPYIRCTCNPESDIWLREFIDWWIGADGYPIPERNGVLRYMYANGDKVSDIIWGATKEEVIRLSKGVIEDIAERYEVSADDLVKSVTFIAGSLEHNKKLLQNNPEYIANLMNLSEEEQLKLLYGNWNKSSEDTEKLFKNTDTIFSNTTKDPNGMYAISVDVARSGKDLAVVMLWHGLEIISMQIFTKCTTEDIYFAIETYREIYNIPTNKVVVDSDGVGGGVVDRGRYLGINNGGSPVESLNETTNFRNLKSQLYYLMARVINNHTITGFKINTDNIYVDGVKSRKVNGTFISDIIRIELGAFKRDFTLGKKSITSKDKIKAAIGHSPDFTDAMAYIFYLYLNKKIFGLNL